MEKFEIQDYNKSQDEFVPLFLTEVSLISLLLSFSISERLEHSFVFREPPRNALAFTPEYKYFIRSINLTR